VELENSYTFINTHSLLQEAFPDFPALRCSSTVLDSLIHPYGFLCLRPDQLRPAHHPRVYGLALQTHFQEFKRAVWCLRLWSQLQWRQRWEDGEFEASASKVRQPLS
jgi:hypothetical protein